MGSSSAFTAALIFALYTDMNKLIKGIYTIVDPEETDNLIELMMVMLVFLGMLLYEFTYIFPLYMFMGLTCGNSLLEGRILKQMK